MGQTVSTSVSACTLFLGADGLVLRCLADARIFLEQVVSPARADGRSARDPFSATTSGAAERDRARAVWTQHDVCGGGLDDVFGAVLVLHHLWVPRNDRAAPGSH